MVVESRPCEEVGYHGKGVSHGRKGGVWSDSV